MAGRWGGGGQKVENKSDRAELKRKIGAKNEGVLKKTGGDRKSEGNVMKIEKRGTDGGEREKNGGGGRGVTRLRTRRSSRRGSLCATRSRKRKR